MPTTSGCRCPTSRPDQRAGRAAVYDHPLTTLPSADRKDLGIFYPIMGHMCHMPVVEVDAATGKVRSSTTSRCTTAAPWSTR